ncbi:hypothetical protein F8C11_26320, partial [Escherichia coli]|nr:hypothetical protein [Escherichia coli]
NTSPPFSLSSSFCSSSLPPSFAGKYFFFRSSPQRSTPPPSFSPQAAHLCPLHLPSPSFFPCTPSSPPSLFSSDISSLPSLSSFPFSFSSSLFSSPLLLPPSPPLPPPPPPSPPPSSPSLPPSLFLSCCPSLRALSLLPSSSFPPQHPQVTQNHTTTLLQAMHNQ